MLEDFHKMLLIINKELKLHKDKSIDKDCKIWVLALQQLAAGYNKINKNKMLIRHRECS